MTAPTIPLTEVRPGRKLVDPQGTVYTIRRDAIGSLYIGARPNRIYLALFHTADAQSLYSFTRPPRGFAAMAPERLHELAVLGGQSINPANRSYSRNRDLAVASGRKGGLVKRAQVVGAEAQ